MSFSDCRHSAPIPAKKSPRAKRCFSGIPESWVIAEIAKRNALSGSPAELYFWRTRAQSEVDLVVKQGDSLRAFEVKWSPRRTSGRAFRDAYGVDVETISSDNPLTAEVAGIIAD
ncbi:MAG: DUF4143 domain-containing protein [Pontiellaceae bacterium]|nr:DUF4143 domain-containing protein [Pontiellaceae bacterium]